MILAPLIARLMRQLGDRIERVEIDDGAAGFEDAVIEDDEGGRVGQQQSDIHALAHAALLQALWRPGPTMR